MTGVGSRYVVRQQGHDTYMRTDDFRRAEVVAKSLSTQGPGRVAIYDEVAGITLVYENGEAVRSHPTP